MRRAWIDATAGVAGDMLLGALIDAGVPIEVVWQAIETVVPGSIELRRREVMRAGMRACKVDPVVLVDDPPHRHWSDIRARLEAADLPEVVRRDAVKVFQRLAVAEAGIHGVDVEQVHFHEVGALDAIADVVGVCAAFNYLGVDHITVSSIAVGAGSVQAAHGRMPVPVPAVLAMTRGWQVCAGGVGELATPTGVALVTALASDFGPLPDMLLETSGIGGGSKDFADHANVVRVAVGTMGVMVGDGAGTSQSVIVEANVDDLDPRVWPTVLERLLADGADDAWLTPILMKKGRPAHTVHALVPPDRLDAVCAVLFTETSTIGLRRIDVRKTALARTWIDVPLEGGTVRVKIAHSDGRIIQATPEFEDAATLARSTGRPVRVVLQDATMQAAAQGSTPGSQVGGAAQ
ncbi:nickel pincer cofactor biosynthesis protein LarC [Nocardia goodfellowii]